ncbi:MAG: dienelactone hydrolase family protein [Pseudonocardiales bacterium]
MPGTRPMAGYLARPATETIRGSVIVGMELFGVSAHVRDVGDRLAGLGFLAVAPDLYHRSAPGIELAADDSGRERGFELLDQLTRSNALDDIRATTAHLDERGTPLTAMVGLSVGGHVAYLAASQLDLPAVVIFYAGWLPTTDITLSQPEPTLALTPYITGRVLMLLGDDDPLIPAQDRRRIGDALQRAGIDHQLVSYPGAGHAFLCDRRDSFRAEAASDAWDRLSAFLTETGYAACGPAAADQPGGMLI